MTWHVEHARDASQAPAQQQVSRHMMMQFKTGTSFTGAQLLAETLAGHGSGHTEGVLQLMLLRAVLAQYARSQQ